MNMVVSHPELVTFGIGVGITFVIGAAIGMANHQAFAVRTECKFSAVCQAS